LLLSFLPPPLTTILSSTLRLFLISISAGILAIVHGMIPEEDMVFDSEVPMKAIVRYTHYLPEEWQAKTM